MDGSYQEKDVNGKKVKVKELTISQVADAIRQTTELDNKPHVSHQLYDVPVAFLSRSIDGFDDYPYTDMPRLIEVFCEVNPIVHQDQRKVIVILGKETGTTGEAGL